MFMSGVELARPRTLLKYCADYYCNKTIPLCAVCVSSDCCESVSKWSHITASEHVCSACYSKILSLFSYNKNSDEILDWKRQWLQHCHESPTVNDYIVEQLMPQWCICCDCGKWRQIFRDIQLSPDKIEIFRCGLIFSCNQSPCEIVEDSRIEFIKKSQPSFFESVKYQPLLETIPFLDIYHSYSFDLVGISPTAKLKDFSIYKCPNFMTTFNPYLKRNMLRMAAGSIDPACMEIWEHNMFPMFGGKLRNLFIGLRNIILMLWAADPKRTIDEKIINKYVLIHGIIRVALMIHTIPDMIRIYSGLGYINYGFIDQPIALLEKHLRVIIIDSNYSGLSTASYLRKLGADVTVLEVHNQSSIFNFFDIAREVQGNINNPLVTMAYQLNIELQNVCKYFTLYNYDGSIINDDVDKYFQDFVYNFIDYMSEELNAITNSTVPSHCSLQDIFNTYQAKTFDNNYTNFSHVKDIYLAELEYRLFGGASMNNISTKFQLHHSRRNCSNFDMKDFCGEIVEPVQDWNVLRENLLSDLTIHYSTKVQSINKVEDWFVISTADKTYEADKIVLSLDPWDIVKIDMTQGILDHNGDLKDMPKDVSSANTLIIVKMIYNENEAFWRVKSSVKMGIFSIASLDSSKRSFCHMFRETIKGDQVILTTRIFGSASSICQDLSDKDIVAMVIKKLHCLTSSSLDPHTFEVHRFENSLLFATDFGLTYSKNVNISHEFNTDVYINKVPRERINYPKNLSLIFASGLETASYLVRDIL